MFICRFIIAVQHHMLSRNNSYNLVRFRFGNTFQLEQEKMILQLSPKLSPNTVLMLWAPCILSIGGQTKFEVLQCDENPRITACSLADIFDWFPPQGGNRSRIYCHCKWVSPTCNSIPALKYKDTVCTRLLSTLPPNSINQDRDTDYGHCSSASIVINDTQPDNIALVDWNQHWQKCETTKT